MRSSIGLFIWAAIGSGLTLLVFDSTRALAVFPLLAIFILMFALFVDNKIRNDVKVVPQRSWAKHSTKPKPDVKSAQVVTNKFDPSSAIGYASIALMSEETFIAPDDNDEPEEIDSDDTLLQDEQSSLFEDSSFDSFSEDMMVINPASGSPMIDGIGGLDMEGNAFGTDDSMFDDTFDSCGSIDCFDATDSFISMDDGFSSTDCCNSFDDSFSSTDW